jgi:hypothetical protein
MSPRFSLELPRRGITALMGVNYPGSGVGGRYSAAGTILANGEP